VSKRILVVEDEADSARYLVTVLADGGYETSWAESCENGWRDIARQLPDMICLDIMMPRQSGLALYRKLKTDDRLRSLPVVVISGAYDADSFRLADFAPDEPLPEPAAFVEKPIDVKSFLKTVRAILGE
jgi:two-component system phosphate regulon response regulator PhoB